jgi:hypothetical protein
MEVLRLQTLDQAKSLVDCVYAVYGLTFHRPWLYEPKRLLELNRSGEIMSYMALDSGRVIGHLAAIQPYFEVKIDGQSYTEPSFREVGLSIVLPEYRGRKIQAQLGLGMSADMVSQGVAGVMTKCVTNHLKSQNDALAMGGTPVALFLGSIPRWVVYGGEPGQQDQPISTMNVYIPVSGTRPRDLYLPRALDWISDRFAPVRAKRQIRRNGPITGPTRIEARWQADRQHAQIHVFEAGVDLVEKLHEKVNWLVGGKMAHLTIFLPGDSPAVAAAGPALANLGMFAAGWIPGFYRGGGDALIYQVITYQTLDPDRVLVAESGRNLKQEVVAAWKDVQSLDLKEQSSNSSSARSKR